MFIKVTQMCFWTSIQTVLCCAILIVLAIPASAQFPQKFTNLQVFSKNIPANELQQHMRRFAFALNVRCVHCHVQNARGLFDYSADDKESKRTARVMLRMLTSINRDFVGKIEKPHPVKV